MDDLISRQAAIDAIRAMQTYKLFAGDDQILVDQAGAQTELMMLPSAEPEKVCIAKISLSEEQIREAVEKVKSEIVQVLPSAEPEDAALHESCNDCPLYDRDRHRCPRFNKVIPTTIQEILDTQTQRWIPVTERMPEVRRSVILSTKNWTGEGCYWETNEYHVIWKGYRYKATFWDDEVVAWMPLPEPYREEEVTG